MLKPTGKLPNPRKPNGSPTAYEKDLREFARSHMDVAVIEVPGKTSKQLSANISAYLRHHRDKFPTVKVARRGDVTYLYKEER